jgi:hypothetical protein
MVHERSMSGVWLAVLATAIWSGAVSAQTRPEVTGFRVGEPFPEIAFPSADAGRPMSLADFRGKKLLLHIFASW